MKDLAIGLQKDGSHHNPKGTKHHIVRFPRLIRRFPRLNAEDLEAAQLIESRLVKLDESAFGLIAKRRTASTELGRVFEEEKEMLGHGGWLEHFEEIFAPLGISLRTAERYMKRARELDATKFVNVSNMKSASDEGAHAIKGADEDAEGQVKAARRRATIINERDLYKLKLHMHDGDKMITDRLCLSPDWPRAEREILRLLRRLCVEYDIVDEEVEQ